MKPNVDFENFNNTLISILSVSFDIPIEILKKPYCKSWIIYHMSLDDRFETLIEYNGFLTEV